MKQKDWLIIFAIFLFPFIAHALNADLKQKYPYAVLTEDHGILNEIDLDSKLDGVKGPPSFSTKAKGYIYWLGEIETGRQQIYYWGFEKIKTTKGCEAYHRNGCHYEQAIKAPDIN